MLTYMLTHADVSQCQEISSLCPTPFICPAGAQTSGFPIVAPPVNARNLTVQPFEGSVSRMSLANFSVQSFNDFWYPVVKKSCELGAPGCFTPGYEVQWPYVQGKDTDECDRFFFVCSFGRMPWRWGCVYALTERMGAGYL